MHFACRYLLLPSHFTRTRARDHRESTHVRLPAPASIGGAPGSLTVNCPVINHYGHSERFRIYLRGGRVSRAGRPRGRWATIQGCRSAFTPDPSGSFSDPPDGPRRRPNNHGLKAGGSMHASLCFWVGFLFFLVGAACAQCFASHRS